MPELLKLTNIGKQGLSTDMLPWELPPEFLSYGRNFRVFAGALESAGGYQNWSSPPSNFNPGFLIHVGATSGDFWLVCGRSAVYAFDGATWSDVSSAVGYAGLGADDELLWSGAMLGQIPIVNNPQGHPEYWSPQSAGTLLKPLAFDATNDWLAKGYSAQLIRAHRNFLFALNTTEGGTDYPDSYRWSHPADINGLPPTWDETDPAFLAGKASLGGDGGQIIDGHSLRDAFCIYSENAIDVLDFSNDEFVWNRREMSATVGLLSRNCVVEVKGKHFFLGDGDVLMNDGHSIQSIAHNRIRKQLNARISIDNYNRSYAVRNNSKNEVWFCVVEDDGDYPNVAYIYNWQDDSWAVRDLPENIAFAGYGSQSEPTQTWDGFGAGDGWDSAGQVWGSAQLTPLDDTIVGANPVTGDVYLLDPRGTADADVTTRLERTDYPLIDSREVTTITRVYPHIDGDVPVDIQFGSQDYPGAPVRWKTAVTFDPTTQRKVDVRTTGELHCWRYDSVGTGSWSLSGMDIEFERSGRR